MVSCSFKKYKLSQATTHGVVANLKNNCKLLFEKTKQILSKKADERSSSAIYCEISAQITIFFAKDLLCFFNRERDEKSSSAIYCEISAQIALFFTKDLPCFFNREREEKSSSAIYCEISAQIALFFYKGLALFFQQGEFFSLFFDT